MEIRSDLVVARNGAKLARNAAKCFYYSSVWRWPKANRRDKSKRLRCFYKMHTWMRRRRETEESVRYQSAFFIQTFLFPKRKRRNADPASIAGFWIFISPREEYARNALASIGFRKLENKKNEACYCRIRKQGATL